MTQYRTVRLPEDLCVQAESSFAGRFENIDALLSFVLAEIVKDDGSKLDQAEDRLIQERLRDLGYI